jgi:hypothetical protein
VEKQGYALVIGNSAYRQLSPLQNPANDARDMAAALQRLGFAVDLRVDANQREMKQAIRDLGENLRGTRAVGVFYFAGHGVQVNGRNYLVPLGTEVRSSADVDIETVPADEVLARMEEARNRVNLIILDACRNNPFPSGVRSSARGLSVMNAPAGSLLAYATAPGSVAEDGSGRNGVYTRELLRNIEVPGLRIEDVFQRTRLAVRRETSARQVPWESSSLTEVLFLSGRPTTSDAAAPQCPPGTIRGESGCTALEVECPSGRRWDGSRCTLSGPVGRGDDCAEGGATSCLTEAERLLDDGADWREVAPRYRAACQAGAAEGCAKLGRLLIDNGEDWREAKTAFRQACEGEDLESCYRLGKLINNREGDWPLARRYFERACKEGLGHSPSCAYLSLGR